MYSLGSAIMNLLFFHDNKKAQNLTKEKSNQETKKLKGSLMAIDSK